MFPRSLSIISILLIFIISVTFKIVNDKRWRLTNLAKCDKIFTTYIFDIFIQQNLITCCFYSSVNGSLYSKGIYKKYDSTFVCFAKIQKCKSVNSYDSFSQLFVLQASFFDIAVIIEVKSYLSAAMGKYILWTYVCAGRLYVSQT